ncbi:MAG: thiamine phosphate synthase [Actinomycetota bacterium]
MGAASGRPPGEPLGDRAGQALDGLVRDRPIGFLAQGSLYLVTPARPAAGDLESFLPRVLEGGVDVVQLREKRMDAAELAGYCSAVRRITTSFGAGFILNDFVSLAAECGADGVHLGQDDMPVTEARSLLGEDAVVGLSTHTPAEIDAAASLPVDYIGVGPVFETPTKPGRPAVGTSLVSYAARNCPRPFYAVGGINLGNLGGVVEAGATRIAVVRALTDAHDPAAAARALKNRLASLP